MNILLIMYLYITNLAASVSGTVLAITANTEYTDPGFQPVKKIIIALVIGLLVGLIYALSLKSQLTSVYKNESAADYTRNNSFKLTDKKDLFLYSKTERTAKPQSAPPAQQPAPPSNNKR